MGPVGMLHDMTWHKIWSMMIMRNHLQMTMIIVTQSKSVTIPKMIMHILHNHRTLTAIPTPVLLPVLPVAMATVMTSIPALLLTLPPIMPVVPVRIGGRLAEHAGNQYHAKG